MDDGEAAPRRRPTLPPRLNDKLQEILTRIREGINTPNPSKWDRFFDVPNRFFSREETKQAAQDDLEEEEADFEDGDLVEQGGRTYVYKVPTQPVSLKSSDPGVPPPKPYAPAISFDADDDEDLERALGLDDPEESEPVDSSNVPTVTPLPPASSDSHADSSNAPAGTTKKTKSKRKRKKKTAVEPVPSPSTEAATAANTASPAPGTTTAANPASPVPAPSVPTVTASSPRATSSGNANLFAIPAASGSGYFVPLPKDVKSIDEAEEIALFLSGRLKTPAPPKPKAASSQPVDHSSSFFIHGTKSGVGLSAVNPDDEADTYSWKPTGHTFNTKIEIPRLASLDKVTQWMVKLNDAISHIKTMMKTVANNPFNGLGPDDITLVMIDIFDCHLLLKTTAKREIARLAFGGMDLDYVSSIQIYQELIKVAAKTQDCFSQEAFMKKLQSLRMKNTTHSDVLKGDTVEKHYLELWFEFCDILETHRAQTESFNDTSVLVHTLMSLIEPQKARQHLVKFLWINSKKGTVVNVFGRPPQLVSPQNIWAAHTLILEQIKDFIDPGLRASSSFLDSLVVEGFHTPNIPKEFIDMSYSPHRRWDNSNTNKRKSGYEATGSGDSGNETTFPNAPSRPGRVQRKKRKFDQPEQTAKGSESKTSEPAVPAPKPKDNPKPKDQPKPKDNKPKDNPSAAPKGAPRGKTYGCILCDKADHKAYSCTTYKNCTCGADIDGKHDPHRCKSGPLTATGKASRNVLIKK